MYDTQQTFGTPYAARFLSASINEVKLETVALVSSKSFAENIANTRGASFRHRMRAHTTYCSRRFAVTRLKAKYRYLCASTAVAIVASGSEKGRKCYGKGRE